MFEKIAARLQELGHRQFESPANARWATPDWLARRDRFRGRAWNPWWTPQQFCWDLQGVSNIEAAAGWRLEEAWIQQNLFSNRFSALVGCYDLNSEFYRLQSASLFLNSSFGIGPEFLQSGEEGPSISPNTSVGARLEIKPIEELVIRTAVLDGVPVDRPDGTLQIESAHAGHSHIENQACRIARLIRT